ncbi:hypothetical protein [Kocuria aegyptia]|uniref:Uncharacterized protein n=1 Tax=Kocuria aegyptia TaxID=330943 RepID=A0ABP4WYI2_9MICC
MDEGTGNSWWYPYPFLDPNGSAGGYGSVAIRVGVLAVAITATASVLVGISRRRPGPAGGLDLGRGDAGERSP